MKTADDLRGEDIIDSRDIIDAAADLRLDVEIEPRELDDDETALLDFDDDNPVGSEYHYGETLIAEHAFTEYAEQLAKDIGAIDPDAGWPLSYIDWEAAADALKMDYHTLEFLGTTYYVRSS